MLTPFLDNIDILISCAIATLICILVGKKLRKSGVEHYSSRILLLSAIINTVMCSILLLLMGVLGFRAIFGANQFGLIHFITTASLFIVPARSLWNGLTMSKRVKKRFALQPIESKELQGETGSLVATVQIPRPVVLSSSLFNAPFVFGRSSRNAILAVPANWSALDRTDRRVMLCHELAHIRNKDVGFLTWSFAFLTDLKWLLILIPLITGMSFFAKVEHLAATNILYLGFLISLWLLTKSVVKKRELLADLTVAMLIESGKIANAISGQRRDLVTGLHAAAGKSKRLQIIDNIRNWLEDKALFAKKKELWKLALKFFRAFYSSHPSAPNRLKTIEDRYHVSSRSSVQLSESFWAGVSIGLFGVLVSLGGFWWGRFFLKLQDDEEIVMISYRFFGAIGPLAIGVVALLFVLPGWSSTTAIVPTGRRLLSLLGRYVMGFLGASAVCSLILVGGWSNIEIKVLLVLSILWIMFILLFGLVVNIVIMILWLQIRYIRLHFFTDFLWAMYSLGPAMAIVLGCFVTGLVLFLKGSVFVGADIIASMLIGVFVYALMAKDSSISGADQYTILSIGRWVYRLEGKRFKLLSPLLDSAHFIILCYGPAFIVFTTIYLTAYQFGKNIGNLPAILALGIVGCTLFVFLGQRWPKRVNEIRRYKICVLFESLFLTGKSISDHSRDIIHKVLDVYTRQNTGNPHDESIFLTTEKIFELSKLIPPEKTAESNMFDQALKWVQECETEGGFGLWPGCTVRLCSTYHSLYILQRASRLSSCKSDKHIVWIKNLQKPAGYFQDPCSKRRKWEDTFFASASLKILGATLDAKQREACLNWTRRTLILQGIERNRADVVYYCLGIIDAIDMINADIVDRVGDWKNSKIDEALIVNISHNFENINFLLKTHHILYKQQEKVFSNEEKLRVLADGINAALEAELARLNF